MGHDTVGAVAFDMDGNVAAATSTGGITFGARHAPPPLPAAVRRQATGLPRQPAALLRAGLGPCFAPGLLSLLQVYRGASATRR